MDPKGDSGLVRLGDDLHVHLRQGQMMRTVASAVLEGGCDRVLVMPNTSPPVSTFSEAERYRRSLEAKEPRVTYMMTLYLTPTLAKTDIGCDIWAANRADRSNGVVGIKSYPKGVTTNSAAGVESFEPYYPLFGQMERHGLSLHIHGEVPGEDIMTAEASFLPRVEKIATAFPQLKVVLEHVTTKEGVDAVKRKPNLAATITAHHLRALASDVLNEDGSVKCPNMFCKPIPKTSDDRKALREAAVSGHPRFFFGSDSAPHPRHAKGGHPPPAGCFTSPVVMPMLLETFDNLGCLSKVEDFTSKFGQEFLGLPPKPRRELVWKRDPHEIPRLYFSPESTTEDDMPEVFENSLRFSVWPVPGRDLD